MVATVVNITSASSTDRYFRVDGFGSGPGASGDDGPDDSRPDDDADEEVIDALLQSEDESGFRARLQGLRRGRG